MSHTVSGDVKPSVRQATRWRMLLALVLYALVAVWLGWYVYDFSADGVAEMFGKAMGALLIPCAIAFFFARRSKSATPYFLAIPITALLLVLGSDGGIRDSYDAAQFKREMATATPENLREVFSRSTTRLGQTLNALLQILESHSHKSEATLASLDDDQFLNMLKSETLLSPEKRSALRNLAKTKQVLARNFEAQIPIEYNRVRQEMEAAASGLSASGKRGVLRGSDESRTLIERLFRDYVGTYSEAYKHLINLYQILDDNDGKFTIRSDGMVIFSQKPPIDVYNRESADLKRALTDQVKLQQQFVRMHQNGITKIVEIGK